MNMLRSPSLRLALPPVLGLYSPVPGCGKSTLANSLAFYSKAQGTSVVPFALHLKAACVRFLMVVANCSERDAKRFIYEDKAEPIPGLDGVTGRIVMQRIGKAGREMHPDLWVNRWRQTVAAKLALGHAVIADDVRAENEAQAVVDLGGEMWKLRRLEAERNADPLVIADVSEGALEKWNFDRTFLNNLTVTGLMEEVARQLDLRPVRCPV